MNCKDNIDLLTHYVITPLSIFFNSFALYIIHKRSINDELASYKTVLVITCILDLLNTSFFFLVDLVSLFLTYSKELLVFNMFY